MDNDYIDYIKKENIKESKKYGRKEIEKFSKLEVEKLSDLLAFLTSCFKFDVDFGSNVLKNIILSLIMSYLDDFDKSYEFIESVKEIIIELEKNYNKS